MDYMIREMREDEYPLLKEFLYEAVYVAKGAAPRTDLLQTLLNCRYISVISAVRA